MRGWIYRKLITYKPVEQRNSYTASNQELVNYIELSTGKLSNHELKDIIELSLSITSARLNFTASKNENDPNKLINIKTAHCVGYASFFTTTCNYLLVKYKLSDSWIAKQQIGKLYLLGTNIHNYFSSPFFKDHDFVIIENKRTGMILAVDPTLHDYFYIGFVRFNNS